MYICISYWPKEARPFFAQAKRTRKPIAETQVLKWFTQAWGCR